MTPKFYSVLIKQTATFSELHNWCEGNCKGKFYVLPTWLQPGCQFEDEKDAFLFALRWT